MLVSRLVLLKSLFFAVVFCIGAMVDAFVVVCWLVLWLRCFSRTILLIIIVVFFYLFSVSCCFHRCVGFVDRLFISSVRLIVCAVALLFGPESQEKVK